MLEYMGIICKSILLEFYVFLSFFLWGWKQVDLVIILCQFLCFNLTMSLYATKTLSLSHQTSLSMTDYERNDFHSLTTRFVYHCLDR